MIKKKFLVAGILSVAALLAGCVEQDTHVTINADGSADVSQSILLSEELSTMAESQGESVADGMLGDVSTEFSEDEGYKSEAVEEDGKQGIKVSKHFDNLEEMIQSELFISEAVQHGEVENPWTVKVDEGFFATNTSIKAEINYDQWLEENAGMTAEEAAMMEQMGNSFDFSYTVTIPVKAVSQNADEVDNRTYTWNVGSDENKTIELEYHVLNMKNVGFVSGVGTVALITVLFLLARARKKKRNQDISAE